VTSGLHYRRTGTYHSEITIPAARHARAVGACLFGLQFVGMVLLSWHMWRRFDLTGDFTSFAQPWEQIAHGHLDPRLTIEAYFYPNYGYPYWQSHLELLMWPLAGLWWVWHSAFDLLVVQDLALAGAGMVAWCWGLDLLEEHWPPVRRLGAVVAATLLLVLLVNPWTYWSAAYDFHFEPIAICFTLLAGRDLWAGRRRGWWWVVVVLACGDVAATYLVALGVTFALAGPSRRRTGGALAGCGVAWLAFITAVGGSKGSLVWLDYGYLAHHPVGTGLGGVGAILWGAAAHPATPLHLIWSRRDDLFKYVAGAGTFGVLTILGLPVLVFVLGANVLDSSVGFIGQNAAFQSEIVVVFAALGTVMAATWLGCRGRVGANLAVALCVLVVAQVAYVSAQWTPRIGTLLQVPAGAASALTAAMARIPPTAEVIVSAGVDGRFDRYRWVYPFEDVFVDGQSVPIDAPDVVFVFTDAAFEFSTPQQTAAAVAYAKGLGAQVFLSRDGVTALRWQVTGRRSSILFPR
jgi:hypothetical protein